MMQYITFIIETDSSTLRLAKSITFLTIASHVIPDALSMRRHEGIY